VHLHTANRREDHACAQRSKACSMHACMHAGMQHTALSKPVHQRTQCALQRTAGGLRRVAEQETAVTIRRKGYEYLRPGPSAHRRNVLRPNAPFALGRLEEIPVQRAALRRQQRRRDPIACSAPLRLPSALWHGLQGTAWACRTPLPQRRFGLEVVDRRVNAPHNVVP
jgi:hypothetical protein